MLMIKMISHVTIIVENFATLPCPAPTKHSINTYTVTNTDNKIDFYLNVNSSKWTDLILYQAKQ